MVDELDGRVGVFFSPLLAFLEEEEPFVEGGCCKFETLTLEDSEERLPCEGVWISDVVDCIIIIMSTIVGIFSFSFSVTAAAVQPRHTNLNNHRRKLINR